MKLFRIHANGKMLEEGRTSYKSHFRNEVEKGDLPTLTQPEPNFKPYRIGDKYQEHVGIRRFFEFFFRRCRDIVHIGYHHPAQYIQNKKGELACLCCHICRSKDLRLANTTPQQAESISDTDEEDSDEVISIAGSPTKKLKMGRF